MIEGDVSALLSQQPAAEADEEALANHLELAYRASYRLVLYFMSRFCLLANMSDRDLLKSMTADYEELGADFPKSSSDIHPIDDLEVSSLQRYGPSPPPKSLLQRFVGFCRTKGKNYFPPITWLPKYSFVMFLQDLLAGISVGVFVVPQGMAYSILAGLPVYVGLYASTVPTWVYSLFGTTPQMAVGPFALISLLVGSALSSVVPIGPTDSPAIVAAQIQASVNLMLYVGMFLTGFGLLRFGFVTNFISKSFLAGFTSASGVLIQTNQLPTLFGEKVGSNYASLSWIDQVQEFIRKLPSSFWPTILTGFVTIVVVILIEQWNRRKPIRIRSTIIMVPSALIVLIFAIIISWAANFQAIGIKVSHYASQSFCVFLFTPFPPSYQACWLHSSWFQSDYCAQL
jgi:hypothetical protein